MQDYEKHPLPHESALEAAGRGRSRSRGGVVFISLLAFLLGGALVAWAASSGYLTRVLPTPDTAGTPTADPTGVEDEDTLVDATAPTGTAKNKPDPSQMAALGTVEGRLALIEDRLSRIDFQTDAASGNAARAESLLIAFAARRMVDRGEPLSYVADQLRLRFMDAQPNAVETIIAFSKQPVTIDELSARLEALSPELTDSGQDVSLWDRASSELGSLFKVHRDSAALVSPKARIERARIMLTARRIDNAINEIQRLPGATSAKKWIADARRYEKVQKALNLLETTAMLEPRRLKDAEGHAVDQPSPLATPPEAQAQDETTPATPAPSATAPD